MKKKTVFASELHYRRLFESTKDGILILDAETGKILDVNPYLIELLGYTKNDFIEKSIWEIGSFKDILKNKERLLELQQKKYVRYEDLPLITADGRVIHVEFVSNVYLVNSNKFIQCQIRDVIARKKTEAALEKTRKGLAQIHRATSDSLNVLLNLMHAPIIIWDTSMIIRRFNHKFEELTGYDSTEVINKNIDLLFPKDKIEKTVELLKNHLDDEYLEVAEIDILTKDNNIRTVLWNSSRILDEEGNNIVATISQDISSRKLMEDRLNLLETRYRRLFESAKDGILILDAGTGKIVDVNPYLIEMLGYSKEEFSEKSIWEIGAFQDIYENKMKFLELQQNGYVRYDDLPLVTASGREIHVEFISNIYLANNIKVIQCNIRDNTENWQIKKQIVESEEKFRTITENSADAIFITDKGGKYIYVNKQAVDLLGYSKDELLTFTLADISPKNRLEEYSQIFQQLFITGSSYSEIELVKKDGSHADTDLNAVLLPNGWIYGSCRDISERKKLENELISAKEKAEESDHLKTAFLHNVSHEIRTPLNAIVGFSGLLNFPGLTPEKQKSYTDTIIESSDQLLAIIDDIISIATIEAGQEKTHEKEININTVCKLLKEQFFQKAHEKHVTLTLKTDLPDDEAVIMTDATKLTQIATNLIDNALKFTQQGYVSFGYTVKDNQLEFYVEDSGIGIPFDLHEKIFDRFRQVETTATRTFGGSGLGLSISKAYAEMLGGKMWVTSELGEGSVFYFTIPYKKVVPEKLPDMPSAKGLNINTNKTILIAEDEDSNYLLLKEMLSDFEIGIIRAVDGHEAVDLCRSGPHIDLVLMDIKMPGMDGYEATMKIKEFKPDLPIIAQTAYSTEADRNRALASGCSDFISKPINKNILLSKLSALLHK